MSEPVANAEIEDVLSSIRRLVTDERRGPNGASTARKKPASKLVLTPALRVPAGQENGAPAAEVAKAPEATAPVSGPFSGRAKAKIDPFSNPPWSNPENTLHGAADKMATGKSPDISDQSSEVGKISAVDETAETVITEPLDDEKMARAATLSAKIQALESAIAQTQDQWEPDGAGGDDYAGIPTRSMNWRNTKDKADSKVTEMNSGSMPETADVVTKPADEPKNEMVDLAGTDEGFLDEEALRELVADIVRQELQGALGERITRNVRKLVRREIQRALTTQEFD